MPVTKLYRIINGEWDDWYIELYQPYPCNNREELQQREREIIRLIGNLNVRGAQNVSEKLALEVEQKTQTRSEEKALNINGCIGQE